MHLIRTVVLLNKMLCSQLLVFQSCKHKPMRLREAIRLDIYEQNDNFLQTFGSPLF